MAKRPDGGGTIRRRERNGRTWWEAQISIGYDAMGKRRRKTITGDTQKEVAQKMRAMTAEVDSGDYLEPSKLTIAKWANQWLETYCTDKRFQTTKGYKAIVETHIKPAMGKIKLSELKPPQIQKFYNDLAKSGKTVIRKNKNGETDVTRSPLSVKTIRNIHGVVTKMLSTAVDIGYLKSNPADRVTVPKMEKTAVNPLTDDQLAAYLKEAANDDYWAILQILPLTGLREAEAIGLTWDCVDLNAGTITVKQQLVKRPLSMGGNILAATKSNNIRTIKPAQTVIDILKRRKAEQIEQRLRAGDLWQAWSSPSEQATAFVFTTDLGRHLTNTSLYYHCKKILAKIGAEDRCVHDLRHTYATISLQNGDDIKTVQGNLGHATASFTLDVYGHVSDRMKEASADRMEQYLAGLK